MWEFTRKERITFSKHCTYHAGTEHVRQEIKTPAGIRQRTEQPLMYGEASLVQLNNPAMVADFTAMVF